MSLKGKKKKILFISCLFIIMLCLTCLDAVSKTDQRDHAEKDGLQAKNTSADEMEDRLIIVSPDDENQQQEDRFPPTAESVKKIVLELNCEESAVQDCNKDGFLVRDGMYKQCMIVCNEDGTDDMEDINGMHGYVERNGNRRIFHGYGDTVSGRKEYETIVWEKGRGIICYNKCYAAIYKNEEVSTENVVRRKKTAEREKTMSRITDIIVTDEYCNALCEDGTVWRWERKKGVKTAEMLPGLEDVVKIVNVGASHETIYALTEDGYIYGWGKNETLLHPEAGFVPREEWDRDCEEPVRIGELSEITELDGGSGKVFALDRDGTFYMWGLDMGREDISDETPGFPQEEKESVEGIEILAAGGGYYNYSYFIKKDGTVISIMEGDRRQQISQYIFPIITEEWETADMSVRDPVSAQYLQEDSVTELGAASKIGEVILYEAGKCGDIEKTASDRYTVFCYLRDGSLWYWDSNRVRFHDDIQLLLRPESKREEYKGCWRKLDYEEILRDTSEGENKIRIVDSCSLEEHILFLTEDGQIFVSEYVTEKTESVEYYWRSPNLIYPSEKRFRTIDLKMVQLKRLEPEHIKSINTDGGSHFSAVDEEGRCWLIDEETLTSEELGNSINGGVLCQR